jgi:hypothetical protein
MLSQNALQTPRIRLATGWAAEKDCRTWVDISDWISVRDAKTIPMEQSTQNPTRPFLCLPPLAPLPLFLISRKSVGRNTKIQDLEEQPTPRHEALRALLMPRQIQYDRVFVRLEDEMQDYGNLLLGASRRRVKQVRGKRDQGSERLLDNSRQDIAVLAESTAERRVKSQLTTEREHSKDGAHRNARTISSTTTVPAPTSRMLLLVRRALAPSRSSGHLSGKSFEMSVLSVLAS